MHALQVSQQKQLYVFPSTVVKNGVHIGFKLMFFDDSLTQLFSLCKYSKCSIVIANLALNGVFR